MDLVVIVAMVILFIVFSGALAALCYICYRHFKAKSDTCDRKPILNGGSFSSAADDILTGNINAHQKHRHLHGNDVQSRDYRSSRNGCGPNSFNALLNDTAVDRSPTLDVDMELEDILVLSPIIAIHKPEDEISSRLSSHSKTALIVEKALKDHEWAFDSGGLIEQSLSILRTCHVICDKLSSIASNPCNRLDRDVIEEVRVATKRVMPRVDDLVQAMCPTASNRQLHSSLVEARAAALVMSVNSLALVFRAACRRVNGAFVADEGINTGTSNDGVCDSHLSWTINWINSLFNDLELRLAELRRIADSQPIISPSPITKEKSGSSQELSTNDTRESMEV